MGFCESFRYCLKLRCSRGRNLGKLNHCNFTCHFVTSFFFGKFFRYFYDILCIFQKERLCINGIRLDNLLTLAIFTIICLSRFHTFFWCFQGWLRTNNWRLGSDICGNGLISKSNFVKKTGIEILENLSYFYYGSTGANHITSNFLKAVFQNFTWFMLEYFASYKAGFLHFHFSTSFRNLTFQ